MKLLQFRQILPVICAVFVAGCSNESHISASLDQRAVQQSQYKSLQAELLMAKADTPYFVFNSTASSIEIRLGGAIVWAEKIERNECEDFQRDLATLKTPPFDYVAERRLLAHQERFPDTLLQVISSALKVDKGLLQRELPIRFLILTAEGITIEFEASEDSLRQENSGSLLRTFDKLFGRNAKQQHLRARLPVERALTLYYASQLGTPILYK